MKTSRMPRLTLPPQVIHQDQAPLHQHHRLAVLRRTLNADSLPLRAQVAAALVLLYAHPVTRIVRLPVDDVIDDGATLTVRLGDPPSPLPEPVADLMRAYIQSPRHLPYASRRSSQWPFPGRRPGQPMNPVGLPLHLRKTGVPPQRGRTSAIRRLLPRPQPSSSRRRSATTTRRPPARSPRPAEPGAGMPRVTTGARPAESPEGRRVSAHPPRRAGRPRWARRARQACRLRFPRGHWRRRRQG